MNIISSLGAYGYSKKSDKGKNKPPPKVIEIWTRREDFVRSACLHISHAYSFYHAMSVNIKSGLLKVTDLWYAVINNQ